MSEADNKQQQNKVKNNNKAPKKLLQKNIVSQSLNNIGLLAALERKISSSLTAEASFARS